MKILVLQHVKVEHPGIFRDFMRADGLAWDTVELDEREDIPELRSYDLMMVMGGPQDVWQEDEHPWLKNEKAAIRSFVVDLKRPFLGVCLGHQLLAESLGGKVGPARQPEVGILTVTKTTEGRRDPVLSGLADPTTVLQWHGAEVISVPPDSTVLAASEKCAVQALRYGHHAYGFQFHVEITEQTVAEWGSIPIYAAALGRELGPDAMAKLKSAVDDRLASFNADARQIYNEFMKMARDNTQRVRNG